MTTLSIVTRCMCRKSFLDQTLPTWIKLKEPQEIIIVDWGMTEDLTDLLLLDPRITILQIPNRQFFNAGASLNIGVDYAGSDIIFHIDSDIKITLFGLSRISETFSKNFFNADMIQTRHPAGSLTGTCFFKKKVWEETNGYIEGFPSWGYEDISFFKKLRMKRFRVLSYFGPREFMHIPHGDDLRYQNFKIKYSQRQDGLNKRYAAENINKPREKIEYTILKSA